MTDLTVARLRKAIRAFNTDPGNGTALADIQRLVDQLANERGRSEAERLYDQMIAKETHR